LQVWQSEHDARPLRPPRGVEIKVLENLPVVTGPPEYGKPQIQRIIEVKWTAPGQTEPARTISL
jgi:hypothetical protein